ncbi:MAG TPA: hypothetical protein VJN68_06235 [Burkholderiaceae bacterium]|nr:hypothetical protein [Burkholderiaceae bacterium]
MSSLKFARGAFVEPPAQEAARRLAALVLLSASAALARLSHRLFAEHVASAAEEVVDPRFEFHAEAGAPEGALYVDGEFAGFVAGVQRL